MSVKQEESPEVEEIQCRDIKAEKNNKATNSSTTSLNNPKVFQKTGMPRGAIDIYLKPIKPSVVTTVDVETDHRCESPEITIIYEKPKPANPPSSLNIPNTRSTPELTRSDSPIEIIGFYTPPVRNITVDIPSNTSGSNTIFSSFKIPKVQTLPLPTETQSDINGNQLRVEALQQELGQINVGIGHAVLTPHLTNLPLLGERVVGKSVITSAAHSNSGDVLSNEEEMIVRPKGKRTQSPFEKRRTARDEKENDGQTPEVCSDREISKNIITAGSTSELLENKESSNEISVFVNENISINGVSEIIEHQSNKISRSQSSKVQDQAILLSSENDEHLQQTSSNGTQVALKGRKRKNSSNLELNELAQLNDVRDPVKPKKYKLLGFNPKQSSASPAESPIPPSSQDHNLSSNTASKSALEVAKAQSTPSKPSKVRRLSSVSSSSSSSLPAIREASCPMRILPMSHKQKIEITPLMQKTRYKDVLKRLTENLHEIYPPGDLVAEIISSCIFKVVGRISKEVYSLAVKFFSELVEIIVCKPESNSYFVGVFERVSAILKSSNSASTDRIVDLMLSSLKDEFKMKEDEKIALQFFKAFTYLLEKDYEQYVSKPVKIRQPLIVHVMLEHCETSPAENNSPWYTFLKRLAQLPFTSKPSPEVTAGMEWIDLIIKHYECYEERLFWQKPGLGKKQLIQDFIRNLADTRMDYGLMFLKVLKPTPFTLEVCQALICRRLSNVTPPKEDWTNILLELSAYLSPRRQDIAQTSTSYQPPDKPELLAFTTFVSAKNQAGESLLHLACQKKKKTFGFEGKEWQISKILQHMKKNRCGDINVRDNGRNTPLHDACYHGNSEIILSIFQHFTDLNEPPGPFRVDLLAKDNDGFTALHNAVCKKKYSCIRLILNSASCLGCKDELLRARTNAGKTVWEQLLTWEADPSVNEADLEEFKKLFGPIPIKRSYFGGVMFPPNVVLSVDRDISLHALVSYWRNVYDIVDPHKTRGRYSLISFPP